MSIFFKKRGYQTFLVLEVAEFYCKNKTLESKAKHDIKRRNINLTIASTQFATVDNKRNINSRFIISLLNHHTIYVRLAAKNGYIIHGKSPIQRMQI